VVDPAAGFLSLLFEVHHQIEDSAGGGTAIGMSPVCTKWVLPPFHLFLLSMTPAERKMVTNWS